MQQAERERKAIAQRLLEIICSGIFSSHASFNVNHAAAAAATAAVAVKGAFTTPLGQRESLAMKGNI
jgi:hypothetical protein